MATRAEHRKNTLLALGDAAIELFRERGVGVTIDEIADAAGVSRRTVFRYVDSKEQLAFVHPMIWFDVFDAALAEVDPLLPLSERLRLCSREIALYIDADPEPPRDAFLTLLEHPELTSGFHAVFHRWIDRIADEVMADDPNPTAATIFRSRVVGSAAMGVVDAATRQWLLSPPGTTYTELQDRGFEFLMPLFSQIDSPVSEELIS